MSSFSCIIPTLGRHTLKESVLSVLAQEDSVEIIVVVDASSDVSKIQKQLSGLELRIISTCKSGVSNLRNLGVRCATSNWITFLDDDDLWLENRVHELKKQIIKHPDCQFFVSRSLQVLGDQIRIRPKKFFEKNTELANSWYNTFFASSSYYMGTSSWTIRKDLAITMEFNANLEIREDLAYLFSVPQNIVQYSSIDNIVYSNRKRAYSRESLSNAIAWMKFLKTKSQHAHLKYFIFEFLRTMILKVLLSRRTELDA